MNIYAYVANDPINGIDPSGLCGSRIKGIEVAGCNSSSYSNSDSEIDEIRGEANNSSGESKSNTSGQGQQGDPQLGENDADDSLAEAFFDFWNRPILDIAEDVAEELTGAPAGFVPPPFTDSQQHIDHMFRPAHGLTDTPANRRAIQGVITLPTHVVRRTHYTQYYRTYTDGTEYWARVQRGQIVNGGRNSKPRFPPK